MGFDKGKMKQIYLFVLFIGALVLVIKYSDWILGGISACFHIAAPFLSGGAAAFVLNLPMKGIENTLLRKWHGKAAVKLKRPLSLLGAILFVAALLSLFIGTLIPQISASTKELGLKIPPFVTNTMMEMNQLTVKYPWLQEAVDRMEVMEVDWEKLFDRILDFMGGGVTGGISDIFGTTVNAASRLISGIVNVFIALIFAIYVLLRKEKLGDQGHRIMTAYLPQKICHFLERLLTMLYKNFSSFISGQCLEALILGTLFVIFMSIFNLPYAVMVGILIAFTALIPVVGAFAGCAIGAFLILIDNPMKALWFLILFLVLQQLENNLIYPRVVGNSVGLPAIWVLVAVSVGGSLFGVAGMLFFIPLLSTFYALLRDSVNQRNQIETHIAQNGEKNE
jgi:predicted PurR-regulated permease PerM